MLLTISGVMRQLFLQFSYILSSLKNVLQWLIPPRIVIRVLWRVIEGKNEPGTRSSPIDTFNVPPSASVIPNSSALKSYSVSRVIVILCIHSGVDRLHFQYTFSFLVIGRIPS